MLSVLLQLWPEWWFECKCLRCRRRRRSWLVWVCHLSQNKPNNSSVLSTCWFNPCISAKQSCSYSNHCTQYTQSLARIASCSFVLSKCVPLAFNACDIRFYPILCYTKRLCCIQRFIWSTNQLMRSKRRHAEKKCVKTFSICDIFRKIFFSEFKSGADLPVHRRQLLLYICQSRKIQCREYWRTKHTSSSSSSAEMYFKTI